MADSITRDGMEFRVQPFDHGAKLGIAVIYKGERRAVRIDNPFAAEIDAEWRANHPEWVAKYG